MSTKRSTKGKVVSQPVRSEEYTTKTGLKLIVTGLPSGTVLAIHNSIEFPKVPTYEVETLSGDIQVFDHEDYDQEDENGNIKHISTLSTPEDKAIWKKYLRESEAANTAMTGKLMRAVIAEGIEADIDESDLESWKLRCQFIDIPVPENPELMKMAYLQSVIFTDKEDVGNILELCMKLTGVSKEAVDEARKSFPDKVQQES